ncbi:hypothetical protein HOK68_02725 [Candidatus Woesearchaeota archaeon]|mgnify:CR=1 FL=1|jgi:hypothetical protein|nr:hypothetical protein [Candidatus Woesearchaeota archaeon]MBT4387111.1 hypothetical protein [Candidatus Woesearchaeota archaeon]MBT4596132.1 hypothetical protein [Candidatus Woesearchaeota archaeon]MBT5741645.1 hypothetical protein [Candidatus Woesearchaeota archaeon]MBT6505666.1 hypothetical protein [Candidatus Woesearchaeota archaeon]
METYGLFEVVKRSGKPNLKTSLEENEEAISRIGRSKCIYTMYSSIPIITALENIKIILNREKPNISSIDDEYKILFQSRELLGMRDNTISFTLFNRERDYQNIPKKNKPKNNTVIELKSDYPHILTTYLGLFLYLHDFEKYKLVHHKLIEKN